MVAEAPVRGLRLPRRRPVPAVLQGGEGGGGAFLPHQRPVHRGSVIFFF